MNLAKTFYYTFNLILLFLNLQSIAQETRWHAISLGADLSRIAVPFIDSTRYGWEISGNYEFIDDVFARVEFGSQSTDFTKANQYHYQSSGAYTRIGIDYNYMKHVDPDSNDKLFIGALYGFTTFYHQADHIRINNSIEYDIVNYTIDRKWLNANWFEISTGMQSHLIHNFYLAWSVRFRIKLWFQPDNIMYTYSIPGYGRAWSNSWVGFNYSLYYKIPFAKKKNQKTSNK